MLDKRYPKSKIADILGVHCSTIYREIQRNSSHHWADKSVHYIGLVAQKKDLKRRKHQLKLQQNAMLRKYVHEKLQSGWSPWQIEGRLRRENSHKTLITHETIYSYIYSDYSVRNKFYKKLRRKHRLRIKQYSRTARVPKQLLIDHRPDTINKRQYCYECFC